MLDFDLSKMALIGAVALIVIGPEKLPRVARTVGTLLGRAQRYVNEVKAEVNRAMDVDALKGMKNAVEQTGREVEHSFRQAGSRFEQEVRDVGSTLSGANGSADGSGNDGVIAFGTTKPVPPPYRSPRKNWRVKRGATPQWYKARGNVRRHILSASARVARYRPKQIPGA
ncbi:MAG: Sec-independent protein translocase subunit TatB [Burkholderiaceae bacterium]|jgi:sec-independent protein translocase protein TatB|nr:Sec-independent protein translocase subunit TatB [Burkholderiaceae bacterium]